MPIEHDDRPWGYYDVVDAGPGFKVKRLVVRPGQRLSYQRHARRSEHWFVVAGSGQITLDGGTRPLGVGDTADIPAGTAHRVACDGTDDLVIIEVQTGSYFGEDDIERFDDDYGRDRAAEIS